MKRATKFDKRMDRLYGVIAVLGFIAFVIWYVNSI